MNATAPQALPNTPAAPQPTQATGAFDPIVFQQKHRIHIDGGSEFDFGDGLDGYLVVHPAELAPANKEAFRQKVELTLRLAEPSFYESDARAKIGKMLGSIVPTALNAEHGKLVEGINSYNTRVQSGVDQQIQNEVVSKHAPMSAALNEPPPPADDPLEIDRLKNGLILYELIHTKLAQNGYQDLPETHVKNMDSPDQVLGDLQLHLGITPQQIREAAAAGGVRGVGKLFGLGDKFVEEMIALGEDATRHQFSNNRINNWILGMGKLGLDAPVEQKIATGLQLRTDETVTMIRAKMGEHYEVPKPIQDEEKRIVEGMKLIPAKLLQAMDKLGFEICYTPDYLADKIAHFSNIYGLNRKASDNPSDLIGTYRIYISKHETLENRLATLVHEAHHLFMPELFTKEEVAQMNQLIAQDDAYIKGWQAVLQSTERNKYQQTPFEELKGLRGAYNAANTTPEAKQAVLESAQRIFSNYGVQITPAILEIKDLDRFKLLMDRANQDLRVEGERYTQGGYDDTSSRLKEMVSREAEILYVRAANDQALAQSIAPGMHRILTQYYPVHLDRMLQRIDQTQHAAANDNQPVQKDSALDPTGAPLLDTAQLAAPTATPAQNPPQPQPPLTTPPLAETTPGTTTPAIHTSAPLPFIGPNHSEQCKGCAACGHTAASAIPNVVAYQPPANQVAHATYGGVTQSPPLCALVPQ